MDRFPAIDHTSYPHLFEWILASAPRSSLIALRGASRALRDHIDAQLMRHVVCTRELSANKKTYHICLSSPAGRIPAMRNWHVGTCPCTGKCTSHPKAPSMAVWDIKGNLPEYQHPALVAHHEPPFQLLRHTHTLDILDLFTCETQKVLGKHASNLKTLRLYSKTYTGPESIAHMGAPTLVLLDHTRRDHMKHLLRVDLPAKLGFHRLVVHQHYRRTPPDLNEVNSGNFSSAHVKELFHVHEDLDGETAPFIIGIPTRRGCTFPEIPFVHMSISEYAAGRGVEEAEAELGELAAGIGKDDVGRSGEVVVD